MTMEAAITETATMMISAVELANLRHEWKHCLSLPPCCS